MRARRLERIPAAVIAAAVLVVGMNGTSIARSDGGERSVTAEVPATVTVRVADGAERTAAAERLVARMSVPERAASIVMAQPPGTDPASLTAFARETGVGGFLLMGSNVPADGGGVQRVTAALREGEGDLPALIAVDQEGGDVARLPDPFAAGTALQGADDDTVRRAFSARGALVQAAGIDVNFGVVADWTDDASSFLSGRVLGRSSAAAAAHTAAAVQGEQVFALSTLKHFPGHGAAPGDSHHVLPRSDLSLDRWRAEAAPPFIAGIEAGAELVMTGHLVFSAVAGRPASLAPEWYRVLREDLHFEGVAVTDDLAMLEASGDPAYADPAATAVAAVAAGADLVLGVSYTSKERVRTVVDAIVRAAEDGRIPPERLTEAATRVAALRLSAGGAVATLCGSCVDTE